MQTIACEITIKVDDDGQLRVYFPEGMPGLIVAAICDLARHTIMTDAARGPVTIHTPAGNN